MASRGEGRWQGQFTLLDFILPIRLRVDRATSSGGQRHRKERIWLCSVQTSVPEYDRRASLVVGLLAANHQSIYTCPTMHLLLRSHSHLDALQYPLLQSLQRDQQQSRACLRLGVHHSGRGTISSFV